MGPAQEKNALCQMQSEWVKPEAERKESQCKKRILRRGGFLLHFNRNPARQLVGFISYVGWVKLGAKIVLQGSTDRSGG